MKMGALELWNGIQKLQQHYNDCILTETVIERG